MRILVLTHRLPYAPNRGDRIRAYHMLHALGQYHEVHLISLVHSTEEQREVSRLESLARSVQVAVARPWRNATRIPCALFQGRPLTHVMLDAPELPEILVRQVATHPPDLVLAYCSGMARFALELPLARFPFILDMVDVDSEKWGLLGQQTRGPRRWIYRREARHLARFEALATGRSQVTTVVNERERVSLLDLAPRANVRVLSNGIDVASFRPGGPPSANPRVIFTGVFNYGPNEQGALWMAQQVWPLVRAIRPDARLALVGASPTRAVRRLATVDSTIEVTGSVPDVRPYLWDAAVAVVPLATARGLQNKALEAVAAGLPIVVTKVVREGLPPNVNPACFVADNRHDFAKAVLTLLERTPDERRELAARAELASLSWSAQLRPLLEMIDATRRESCVRSA